MGLQTAKAITSLGGTVSGAGMNLFDKFQKIQKAVSKYEIAAQVYSSVTEQIKEAEKIADADEAMAKLDNLLNGVKKGLFGSNADSEAKLYGLELFQHHASEAMKKLEQKAVKQRFHAAQYQIANTLDQYTQQASSSALGGDMETAKKIQADVGKMLAPLVKEGFIKTRDAVRTEKRIRESVAQNYYAGLYQKFIDSKDLEGAESVKKAVIANRTLSAGAKDKTMSLLNKIGHGHVFANNLDGSSARDLESEAIWLAKTQGKQLTTEQLTKLRLISPKKVHDVERRVSEGITEHSIVQSQLFTPLAQKAAFAGHLDEQIQRETNFKKAAVLKETKKRLEEEVKSMQENPVVFYRHVDAELEKTQPDKSSEGQLKEYQNTPEFKALGSKEEQDRALKIRKAKYIIELEKQLGMPSSLIEKKEAERYVTELKTLPIDVQLAQLKKMQDNYGQYFGAAYNDLVKAKLPAETKIGLGVHPTFLNTFAAAIKDAKELKKLKYGELKLDDAINAGVEKYNIEFFKTLPPEEANNYRAVITSSVRQILSSSDKDIKTAVKEATEGIYQHRYSRIKNGVRIPKQAGGADIDSSSVLKTMKERFNELKKADDFLIPKGVDKKNYKALILGGYWKTMPDDSGVYFVAANGDPVIGKSGGIFHISFLEAEK